MSEIMQMDIHAIMRLLPHRYPFLLIDRVTECVPGEYLTGIKNVTANESFFQGHFPQRPVMPGVIILEAMAQATGLLAFATAGTPEDDTLYYLVGIDKARFRRPVEPGDQLVLKASLSGTRRNIWMFSATAEVDGKAVSSAEMKCAPRSSDR
ncbi:MAG: 3-hydroxyacyl-ACP dehydratase FabZ [Gammaproteobacteria bacterium]|nr:3-hydroxyacyl-ACP dehydratase FabZ [Gammaproteobacteria bacterium]MDH3768601.1 3-hydroxyacyl-ACP dehydratase FabZ [Gammaproteobacteria bacterium]